MKKIPVLLVTGGGHHDFERGGKILAECLSSSRFFRLETSSDLSSIRAENLARFQVIVLYTQGEGLTARQVRELGRWVSAGGGLVGLHCAADSFVSQPGYLDLLGSRFVDHGPVHEFEVTPTEVDHFITRRIPPFRIEDELYLLEGDASRRTILATAQWRGTRQAMAYVREQGKGRVAYLALGHDEAALNHPSLQKMAVRAVRWSSGAQEKPTVRCGVIGYGGAFDMGKAHAEMMNAVPGLEFVAVCDVEPSRTQAALADFPGIAAYDRIQDLLKMKDLDLVTLVTPHHTHGALGEKCARAGKHVITEKPMCLTSKEAQRMIAAAEKSGTLLSVFHNRRWDGDYQTLKKIVRSGAIGEVFQIETFMGAYEHPGWWWRSDKEISGGCLYDWGAHFVDWILNLVPSRPVSVTGAFQKKHWHGVTNEDHTFALIRFENGATASVEISSLAAAGKNRWRILGTQGAATRGDWQDDAWEVTSHVGGQRVVSRVPFQKDDWLAYYRNVADHLLMGEDLEVKPGQGAQVISILETAEKSWLKGTSLPLSKSIGGPYPRRSD